jgi:hypothetical protein
MTQLARVCLALALCLIAARARAHAPLPRAVAVSADGASIALALPGFGLLLRTSARSEFVYACDAMLGVPPSDAPPALQYFADGSWLIASSGGLHTFDADGCERVASHVTLGRSPISAIAIHAASQVAYAVGYGYGDGIWRSEDLGAQWQRMGAVEAADRVSALLVDPVDAARLYVSTDAALSVSIDSGATFQTLPQERALRLLAVQAPARLWAVARALDNKGNRGFDILRADAPGMPWQSSLRVNYFGGLTITSNAEIWVGDEGGGVYRSIDQGESFAPVAAPRSVSCLASAGNEVWAGTPALPAAPALSVLDAATTSFVPSISLAEVDAQMICPHNTQHGDPCQAAWVEWQRDVIGREPVLGETTAEQAPQDAGQPMPEAPSPHAPAGCSVYVNAREASLAWVIVALFCAGVRQRLVRRALRNLAANRDRTAVG